MYEDLDYILNLWALLKLKVYPLRNFININFIDPQIISTGYDLPQQLTNKPHHTF